MPLKLRNEEIDTVTGIQILDETFGIHHRVITFEKGMNQTLFLLPMNK